MKNDTGNRIRRARKEKGLTQLELSTLAGLEGSTVRHYELGRRSPSSKALDRLAEALGVPPVSLMNLSPATDREALEMLFRLEEKCRCCPQVSGDSVTISFDDTDEELKDMIAAWFDKREQLGCGEITEEEYSAWKAAFKDCS